MYAHGALEFNQDDASSEQGSSPDSLPELSPNPVVYELSASEPVTAASSTEVFNSPAAISRDAFVGARSRSRTALVYRASPPKGMGNVWLSLDIPRRPLRMPHTHMQQWWYALCPIPKLCMFQSTPSCTVATALFFERKCVWSLYDFGHLTKLNWRK